jgi:hypothetical protein
VLRALDELLPFVVGALTLWLMLSSLAYGPILWGWAGALVEIVLG